MDPFSDFNRPHMARGDYVIGGMVVVINEHVPRPHVGDEVKPICPHPALRMLCRWFGREMSPVAWVCGNRIEEEQMITAAGRVFMSAKAFDAMKRAMPR